MPLKCEKWISSRPQHAWKMRQRELDQLDSNKSNARRRTLAARQIETARLDRLTRKRKHCASSLTGLSRSGLSEHEKLAHRPLANILRTGQHPAPSSRAARRVDGLATVRNRLHLGRSGKLTYPVIGTVTGKYDGLQARGSAGRVWP